MRVKLQIDLLINGEVEQVYKEPIQLCTVGPVIESILLETHKPRLDQHVIQIYVIPVV